MKTYSRVINSVLFCVIVLLLQSKAFALAPVESLVLGNFSENYSESQTDPLSYVFNRDQGLKNQQDENKRILAQYRGFYEEGKNLLNYCKEERIIKYADEWEKIQAKRSIMALIQYIGLDLVTRALPKYAKQLEYSREDYSNMVEGLVGNYCSANLSVISKKELLNNFYLKFDKENSFELPSEKKNTLFPDNLDDYISPKKALAQEFLYTVKLFQALCSWGGNPANPGLMVPILRHSALMAFFIRQMNNESIEWKAVDNSLTIKKNKNTVQVWCENLICRKTDSATFKTKVNLSIGGTDLGEDLKRLYCEDFRTTSYRPADNDERLAKMMNAISFDEENFINSQFYALITGIPDFLLRSEKFSDGEEILRSSVDYTWTTWARRMSEDFSRELFFEEPLTLELVDRAQYTNFYTKELKLSFDVNLGEFDRINQRAGKIKVSFVMKVQNSFLRYFRQTLKDLNLGDGTKEEKARLLNRFKIQISKDVQEAKEKFIIPPWKGDLESLMVNELTAQILEKPEKILNLEDNGTQNIQVEINYGLFALKYLNHQMTVLKNQKKIP